MNNLMRVKVWLDAQTDDFGHCEGCEVDCRCGHCWTMRDALLAVLELGPSDAMVKAVAEQLGIPLD